MMCRHTDNFKIVEYLQTFNYRLHLFTNT